MLTTTLHPESDDSCSFCFFPDGVITAELFCDVAVGVVMVSDCGGSSFTMTDTATSSESPKSPEIYKRILESQPKKQHEIKRGSNWQISLH